MVSAVLTNRTEQHRREGASAAASDDEAVGPVGRLDQHRCGVSLPHAERDGNVGVLGSRVNGQVLVPAGGHEKVPTPQGLISWV